MPPFISPMFQYHGRRPNQIDEAELLSFLCPPARAQDMPLKQKLCYGCTVSVGSGTTKDGATFSLNKSQDGATITLEGAIISGDVIYKTHMTAKKVKDDLYQINALTFDNHVEKLESRWEIAKVLAHIGEKQMKPTAQGIVPKPHEERGKFGKFSRFLDRCMPDDPATMGYPPF